MSNFLNIPSFGGTPSSGFKNNLAAASSSKTRIKVALKPGRSLMDWIRLGSTKDLSGTGGKYRPVTTSELNSHNKQNDAWMCIHGKVYNVTDYMEYHPGGIPELMRGAGIDATDLFMEVHRWVNFESMLKPCLIGPLVDSGKAVKKGTAQPSSSSLMPPPPAAAPVAPASSTSQAPSFDWFQTDNKINAVFYTKWKGMVRENVILEYFENRRKLSVTLLLETTVYTAILAFDRVFVGECDVSVSEKNGRVSIELTKESGSPMWQSVKVAQSSTTSRESTSDISYMSCEVRRIQKVTHDTFLYYIGLPSNVRMPVPVGHHVIVKGKVMDVEMTNQYTVVSETLLSTSDEQTQGKCLFLMIKLYPDGALTSSCIGKLKPRDTISISRLHQGTFAPSEIKGAQFVLLLAAGTGFTPMVRLVQLVLAKNSNCNVKLVFFNKTEADILWREQLDVAQQRHKNFSVVHALSQAPASWKGLAGRVSRKLVEQVAPEVIKNKSKAFCAACGPLVFTNLCIEILQSVGIDTSKIHAFKG